MAKYYMVAEDTLKDLLAGTLRDEILDQMGVDNWNGYGEGFSDYKANVVKAIYDSHGEAPPFTREDIDCMTFKDVAEIMLKKAVAFENRWVEI